jgi:large subunit ribosomal protein L23
MPTIHETIVRPIISERSSTAYQNLGEYTFEVHVKATKHGIANAIQILFGVTVTDVWTLNCRGKQRTVGKSKGQRNNYKKAIVRLKAGDTIPVFEG